MSEALARVSKERSRCARLLENAINDAHPFTGQDLSDVLTLIRSRRTLDAQVVEEQSRCARIVEAAALHFEDHLVVARHALSAIRLARDPADPPRELAVVQEADEHYASAEGCGSST